MDVLEGLNAAVRYIEEHLREKPDLERAAGQRGVLGQVVRHMGRRCVQHRAQAGGRGRPGTHGGHRHPRGDLRRVPDRLWRFRRG